MPLGKKSKISLIHKDKQLNKQAIDTIDQGVPQSISFSGSLTVEAALVFPLFLFALVGILFLFRVLQVEQGTAQALAATGSWISLECTEEKDETAMVKAVACFYKELQEHQCPVSGIMGGRAGISFGESSFQGEYVDLWIRYQCRMPVPLLGIRSVPIVQRVCMKKWNGYHKDLQTEGLEQWVYITPNGRVYHTQKTCTHLQLSIHTMGPEEVKNSGYSACLFCGKAAMNGGYYYVTREGMRYHTRLNCSGLKRTLYMIKLSEAQGRSLCSRCGGAG